MKKENKREEREGKRKTTENKSINVIKIQLEIRKNLLKEEE